MQTHETSAIVTGGASGLGAATAAALAAQGVHVFALDLAQGIEQAAQITSEPGMRWPYVASIWATLVPIIRET